MTFASLSLVGQYCDEFRSSTHEGDDPGTFGLENYNNWLDAIGEQDVLTEAEFRNAVISAGFNPDDVLSGE